jgi:hypothetical protein
MIASRITVVLAVLLLCVYTADPTALVQNILDVTAVYNLPWYSGYLLPEPNNHMHYFFPSKSNSSTDPLLL